MLAGLAQVESWEIYATIVGSVTCLSLSLLIFFQRRHSCDPIATHLGFPFASRLVDGT